MKCHSHPSSDKQNLFRFLFSPFSAIVNPFRSRVLLTAENPRIRPRMRLSFWEVHVTTDNLPHFTLIMINGFQKCIHDFNYFIKYDHKCLDHFSMYACMYVFHMVGWLVGWFHSVSTPFASFNAKFSFLMKVLNNFSLIKVHLFLYTQISVKIVLFPIIQFSNF